MTVIQPGDRVPTFRLQGHNETELTEQDLAGQTTVLVFYPFAFSPVCTDQLNLYHDVLDEFSAAGVDAIYGISCDPIWSQRAFKDSLGVSIEQFSDFEPKGDTCRAFGVYHPGGFAERALVIVNPDLTVKWSHQSESPGVLPGANLLFDALGG